MLNNFCAATAKINLWRTAFLASLLLLANFLLAACGDETAEVPKYSGAVALSVSDKIQNQFANFIKDKAFRNAKIEVYKTADEAAKIKTSLSNSFIKDGWQDILNDISKEGGPAMLQSFENIGGFVISFSKGNKSAVVMAFPGTGAEVLGLSDVRPSETILLTISGNG